MLYVSVSSHLSRQKTAEDHHIDPVLLDLIPKSSVQDRIRFLQNLVKQISPPTGQKQITRAIHPDWMVIFGCVVGLLFVYRMSVTNTGSLPVMISLLSIGLLFYIISRRPVLHRYNERLRNERESIRRLDLATERWMRLYICSKDMLIFDPERHLVVSVDRLSDLLFDREEKSNYRESGGIK